MSARTDHPEAAIAFARWIASEPVQSGVYLANEGQPANRRTWLAQRDGDAEPFFRGGFATIDAAWTRPRDPWFLGLVDDVCAIMPDFFRKRIPEDAFLAEIDRLYRHHRAGA